MKNTPTVKAITLNTDPIANTELDGNLITLKTARNIFLLILSIYIHLSYVTSLTQTGVYDCLKVLRLIRYRLARELTPVYLPLPMPVIHFQGEVRFSSIVTIFVNILHLCARSNIYLKLQDPRSWILGTQDMVRVETYIQELLNSFELLTENC